MSETATPRTDEIVEYLEYQFPPTIGHKPLREKISALEIELAEITARHESSKKVWQMAFANERAHLKDELTSALSWLEVMEKDLVFHGHNVQAARNEGQFGMPQGKCECRVCRSFYVERDTALSELAQAKEEVNRLTDAMSWSEAKAQEDAAQLRVELAQCKRERDSANARFAKAEKALNVLGYEEHGIGWVIPIVE